MRNQNRITPAQARQLMQQRAILWDVRTPAEYAAGHIPSARNVPLDRLEEVIVCCRSGQRSAIAAELLAQAGRQVYDLGSINCWDGPLTR